IFPGLDLEVFKYGDETEWHNFHFNIPPSNSNFKNSPYYYNNKRLVHFTNLQALYSIIQGQSLRLYNLNNLDDPREFIFASKIFNLTDNLITDAKENLYVSSFCEKKILGIPFASTEFNMWRLYGDLGKGIAIVFSIENDPSVWLDFHLSRVIYGSKSRYSFNKLLKTINEFNRIGSHADIDLGKLYPFHKSNLFKLENEVRLVYDQRNKRTGIQRRTIVDSTHKIVFPNLIKDYSKSQQNSCNIGYLSLPISSQDYPVSIEDSIPLLKIEEVIIGYNFIPGSSDIHENIENACFRHLGYVPKIKQTRLAKLYWGNPKN
ncbi:MAG: DUF2971 domain-containing protein, partial [Candidatus Odinarchaeota archaeon]